MAPNSARMDKEKRNTDAQESREAVLIQARVLPIRLHGLSSGKQQKVTITQRVESAEAFSG